MLLLFFFHHLALITFRVDTSQQVLPADFSAALRRWASSVTPSRRTFHRAVSNAEKGGFLFETSSRGR